jgi:hypothetical protein
MTIERVVETDEASMIASLCIGILTIPQSKHIDALVVPQGMDEIWRIGDVVSIWDYEKTHAKHLFIAGDNTTGKNQTAVSIETLRRPPYYLRIEKGVEVKPYDDNTLTQTTWVAEKMYEHGLQSLALCVSSYHLVRWYLTFIKTVEKMGRERLAVIPYPTPVSMNKLIPQSNATPWESVAGEVKRILAYQAKTPNDVATLPELEKYLMWLWEESVIGKTF